MKTSEKNQQVLANQSGQKNQGSKSNQGNQTKSSDTLQKPSTLVKGEKEKPDTQIERPSREHQHDYKTPEGKPNRSNENKGSKKKN